MTVKGRGRPIIMYGKNLQHKALWVKDLKHVLWAAQGKKGPDPSRALEGGSSSDSKKNSPPAGKTYSLDTIEPSQSSHFAYLCYSQPELLRALPHKGEKKKKTVEERKKPKNMKTKMISTKMKSQNLKVSSSALRLCSTHELSHTHVPFHFSNKANDDSDEDAEVEFVNVKKDKATKEKERQGATKKEVIHLVLFCSISNVFKTSLCLSFAEQALSTWFR